MGGLRRIIAQADQSSIATRSVAWDKEKILIQTAVATIPPALTYKVYTTAYGTPPVVSLYLSGTYNKRGSMQMDVVRSRPGSFQWRGSPIFSVRWSAIGKT
jgi:hypothetical protein